MMTAQAKPETEAPLTHDLASLTCALAYTTDPMDRVTFARVAKTFLARHEAQLGAPSIVAAKQRVRELDREWEQSLWAARRYA